METYFFDTNGNLWMTCSMDVDGAEAFGPSGAAVHIDVAHKADETRGPRRLGSGSSSAGSGTRWSMAA